jgi:hypothetical protein
MCWHVRVLCRGRGDGGIEEVTNYWWLGSVIVEKQKEHSWGNGIVERLALDLCAEFPGISGFSRRNLYDMRRFFFFYTGDPVRQIVAQIPWGHHLIVLNKDPSG